jgi:hypothetical protein
VRVVQACARDRSRLRRAAWQGRRLELRGPLFLRRSGRRRCGWRVVGLVDVADDLPLAVDSPPNLHVFPTHIGGSLASHDILAAYIAEFAAGLRRERGSGQLEGRRFLVSFDNCAPSMKRSLVRPVSWRC